MNELHVIVFFPDLNKEQTQKIADEILETFKRKGQTPRCNIR